MWKKTLRTVQTVTMNIQITCCINVWGASQNIVVNVIILMKVKFVQNAAWVQELS